MPRPPRLHIPGAHYHVILRGNHREALFASIADRSALNGIVGDVVQTSGVRIHAFCWMTNHLHALVQIADRPLGALMQRIAMRYSRHRHKALRTTGHLFERRYKAKLIEVDAYFLTLVRYIHLNPVKARMVARPGDYPWSSHRAYLGSESIPWLTTDFGLSLFSTDTMRARAAYEQFIDDEDESEGQPDEHAHPKDSRVLGTDDFLAKIPFIPFRPRSPLTLDKLAAQLAQQQQISIDLLRSPSRARHLAAIRAELVSQAVEQRIATLSEVARFLHREPSSLTRLLARHTARSNGK